MADWILPLIAGLGLGSLLKSVVDHFMGRRASEQDRWYQEKREAYFGLLSAIHEAAVKPSDAASKSYALWQSKCELFGSKDVRRFAQQFAETPPLMLERGKIFENLVKAMRADLHGR